MTRYFALDHLGSIAATVRASGTELSPRSYDSWGKQRFVTGVDDTANTLPAANAEARGFIGQEQIAQLALVNLNRRLYDPRIGRFLAADPVSDSICLSQSLNRYSYVMNNPLTLSDPSGYGWGPFTFIERAFKSFNTFLDRAFGPARPILAIAAAVLMQFEFMP